MQMHPVHSQSTRQQPAARLVVRHCCGPEALPLLLLLLSVALRFIDSGGVYKLEFGPKAFIVVSDPVVVRYLLKVRGSQGGGNRAAAQWRRRRGQQQQRQLQQQRGRTAVATAVVVVMRAGCRQEDRCWPHMFQVPVRPAAAHADKTSSCTDVQPQPAAQCVAAVIQLVPAPLFPPCLTPSCHTVLS